MRKSRKLIIIMFLYTMVNAVGESAVIALEFPAGAENTGLGEIGVSYAQTVYSVFWNPANVACLYEETYLNHGYTQFHESLLPAFHLPDLYHDFYAFFTSLNNIFPHIDIGYAYFKNFLNFGKNYLYDSVGVVLDSFYSDETVKANCFGVRVFDIFSLGFSFKSYDSRLAPGIGGPQFPNDGTAQGHAFDFGIRINKRFEFFDIFTINPAIGATALNMGRDSAQYMHSSEEKDPLPRKGIMGGSCEVNILDFIGYTLIGEVDFSLVSKKHEHLIFKIKSYEKITHIGHKLQITPFYARLWGVMNDKAGRRYEKTRGYVVSINLKKTINMIANIIKLYDILSHSNKYESYIKLDKEFSLGKFTFQPNMHYSKSRSVIDSEFTSIARHMQTRNDWSFGIGVMGEFPNFFKMKENILEDNYQETDQEEKPEEEIQEEIILEEEDGQLVE